MSTAAQETLQKLEQHGFKARTVSTVHLKELQEDLDKLVRQGLLDESFQQRFLRFVYNPLDIISEARTIFIIALPARMTRFSFTWQGQTLYGNISPNYMVKTAQVNAGDTLINTLKDSGYKAVPAKLPFKTLAVRSGLAQYGRNNLAYVPGLGNFVRLAAYYSDCTCDSDSWHELQMMSTCADCNICYKACPTGSMHQDRFLISAEKCLTWSSQDDAVVLEWVGSHWHNMLLGCMLCQLTCPVNKVQAANIVDGPEFTEEETGLILQRTPRDQMQEQTRQKLAEIAEEAVYNMLVRNLKAVMIARGAI
jgi:epoxyqueuosine reductase